MILNIKFVKMKLFVTSVPHYLKLAYYKRKLLIFYSSDRRRPRRRDDSVDNYRDRSHTPDRHGRCSNRYEASHNNRYRDQSGGHSSHRNSNRDPIRTRRQGRRRSYRHRRRSSFTSSSSNRVSFCSRDNKSNFGLFSITFLSKVQNLHLRMEFVMLVL